MFWVIISLIISLSLFLKSPEKNPTGLLCDPTQVVTWDRIPFVLRFTDYIEDKNNVELMIIKR